MLIVTCFVITSANYAQCPVIKSYLLSDQKDDYYCSTNLNLTLSVDLPSGASNVSYSCSWTGSNSSAIVSFTGNTAVISDTGTYIVSGSVSYVLNSSPQTCSFDTANIVILDGNSSSGTITPKHYWTFEPQAAYPITLNTSPGSTTDYTYPAGGSNCGTGNYALRDMEIDLMTIKSCTDHNTDHNMYNVTTSATTTYLTSSGIVGNCAVMEQRLGTNFVLSNEKELSYEYLVKFDEDYIFGLWEYSSNSFLYAKFEASKIDLGVSFYRNGSASLTKETKTIDLDGVDRKSWSYYLDNEWHHVTITADLTRGRLRLFIDGISPDGFTHQYFPDQSDVFNGAYHHFFGTFNYYGLNEFGEIDEVAISNDVLPPTLIYAHYDQAINQNVHYSFVNSLNYCATGSSNVPLTIGGIDSLEYPSGYTGSITNTQNIAAPLDQMQASPFPRYKPDHTLMRNFPWIDYLYLGGGFHPYNSNSYQDNASEINAELALHWNYLTFIGSPFYSGVQDFANEHPEIASCQIGVWPGKGNIRSTSLNADYYRKDYSGKETTYWNPKPPMDVIKMDGERMYEEELKPKMIGLQRPLDLFNEDGEVSPHHSHWKETSTAHGFNPRVLNEYQGSGLDWNEYMGMAKNRLREAYRDALLESSPLLGGKTSFSFYSVDGMGGHMMFQTRAWSQLKTIQENFQGTNYYSTPDFYPGTPSAWENGGGHGVSWIRMCRHVELADNDALFSPFVAAGWFEDPSKNIRPGQWLGLMKAFGVLGAEFYYTGFFGGVRKRTDANGNLVLDSNNHPIYIKQDPKHWAWQMLIPSYAQAITSRYETLMKEGEPLEDPELTTTFGLKEPYFALKGGGANVYTVAKRWINPANAADTQYVISTTYQTRTNHETTPGWQSPREKDITLKAFDSGALGNLTLKSRRQGSTYILRKDEINYSEPVFVQLDGWHEPWHPTRWSEDFVFEAEVPDELIQVATSVNDREFMSIRTRINDPGLGGERVPRNTDEMYTDFVSYYTFSNYNPVNNPPQVPSSNWGINGNGPKLIYRFRVNQGLKDYRLYVRARIKQPLGGGTTGINVNLKSEDKDLQLYSDYIGCIHDPEWRWYSFGLCDEIDFNQLEKGYYLLELIPENEMVEIDRIILDYNKDISSLPMADLMGACGSPLPNSGNPYNVDIDFAWETDCQGEVQFTSSIWPLLDTSCGQNNRFEWIFVDPSGVQFSPITTGVGTGAIPTDSIPFVSGTYENPVFDFPGAGYYEVTFLATMNGITYTVGDTILLKDTAIVDVFLNSGTSPISICEGQEVTLSSSVSGGLTPYTYSWGPSLTVLSPDQDSTQALPDSYNGTTSNEFELTVIDANGCKGRGKAPTITVNPPLQVEVSSNLVNPKDTVCYGQQSGASLTASVPVGSSSYSYVWRSHNQLSSTTGATVNIVNSGGIQTARYHVTATDNANGCVGKGYIDIVTDKAQFSVDMGNQKNTIRIVRCTGDKSQISSSMVSVLNGAGTYTYFWDSEELGSSPKTTYTVLGDGNGTNTGNTILIGDGSTPLAPTLYTVTVYDGVCAAKGYIWLDIKDTPSINAINNGQCVSSGNFKDITLEADHPIDGAVYAYSWSSSINPNYLSGPTNTKKVTIKPPSNTPISGIYTVTVTDDACSDVANIQVSTSTGACLRVKSSNQEEPLDGKVFAIERGEVVLYPNPNEGVFQLQFSGSLEEEILHVTIIDLSGKVIHQQLKQKNNLLQLDVKGIAKGVYFIHLYNNSYNKRISTVIK
jgi:hypothetical protein